MMIDLFTNKIFRLTSALLLGVAVLLTACTGGGKFRIKGDTLEGKELTLRVVVYTGEGVRTAVLATRSGHFEYEDVVPEGDLPVYIEIYSHDYHLLGLAQATRGSELTMTVDPQGLSGFRVTDSNDDTPESFGALLGAWLKENPRPDNKAIEKFVAAHPESPVAYALLSTLYDASATDSRARQLYAALKAPALPAFYDNGFATLLRRADEVPDSLPAVEILCAADTFFTIDATKYKGGVLIAFTTDDSERADSVAPMLQRLATGASARKQLVVEHSVANDSATWRRLLRSDLRNFTRNNNTEGSEHINDEKILWTSVWSGAGPSAPYANCFDITGLPYFVVADSTAVIRYSGLSADSARVVLKRLGRSK